MLRIVVVVAGSLALAAGLFVAMVPLDDILDYLRPPIPPHMYRCADLRDPNHRATRAEMDEAAKVGLRLPWSGPGGVPRLQPSSVGMSRNGNASDNVMRGSDGDDSFFGAKGNDRMIGGKGIDIYFADIGHGQDVVEDTSGQNALIFLAAVDLDTITVETRLPQGLRVRYSATDTVTLVGVNSVAESANWFVESSCRGQARPLATLQVVEAPPTTEAE